MGCKASVPVNSPSTGTCSMVKRARSRVAPADLGSTAKKLCFEEVAVDNLEVVQCPGVLYCRTRGCSNIICDREKCRGKGCKRIYQFQSNLCAECGNEAAYRRAERGSQPTAPYKPPIQLPGGVNYKDLFGAFSIKQESPATMQLHVKAILFNIETKTIRFVDTIPDGIFCMECGGQKGNVQALCHKHTLEVLKRH